MEKRKRIVLFSNQRGGVLAGALSGTYFQLTVTPPCPILYTQFACNTSHQGGRYMQQQPESPLPSQRTRPALPRMRPPAAVVAGSFRSSHAQASASRQRGLWGKIALLLLLLLLIEVGLLALYPLFITTNSTGDALQKAWSALFPWIPRLYWTNTPVAQGELSLVTWLSPLTAIGKRHLIICATALALVGSLLDRKST